ncbi:MAG TPA: PAS domain S-box protein, partial [Acidimicrobiales bacterium]|nr:PAS domain S-box protein [Acidimicrobiales bacterium]
MTDVSDRTASSRAESAPDEALLASLTGLDIFRSLPDGTALIDTLGVLRHVNDALVQMSGFTRDELVGRDVQMLVPERHRDLERGARRQYSGDPSQPLIWSDLDLTMLCAGGRELPVDFAMSPIQVGDESWALAMVRDRSVRQSQERARTDAELRARVAFESNMAPMSLTDPDDLIIAVNDAFCQMTGFAREELIGQDSTPFTHPDDFGITETTLARAISGEIEQERYEKRYLRKDGRVI